MINIIKPRSATYRLILPHFITHFLGMSEHFVKDGTQTSGKKAIATRSCTILTYNINTAFLQVTLLRLQQIQLLHPDGGNPLLQH